MPRGSERTNGSSFFSPHRWHLWHGILLTCCTGAHFVGRSIATPYFQRVFETLFIGCREPVVSRSPGRSIGRFGIRAKINPHSRVPAHAGPRASPRLLYYFRSFRRVARALPRTHKHPRSQPSPPPASSCFILSEASPSKQQHVRPRVHHRRGPRPALRVRHGPDELHGRRRHAQGRVHHRYHRPGRLLPGRAPPLQGCVLTRRDLCRREPRVPRGRAWSDRCDLETPCLAWRRRRSRNRARSRARLSRADG